MIASEQYRYAQDRYLVNQVKPLMITSTNCLRIFTIPAVDDSIHTVHNSNILSNVFLNAVSKISALPLASSFVTLQPQRHACRLMHLKGLKDLILFKMSAISLRL